MVTTDRVSAFDHVLGTIPFKGQILTEIANFWFEKTQNIALESQTLLKESQKIGTAIQTFNLN